MKIHKKIAKIFGYDLVRTRKNHSTLDAHLHCLFRLLKINLVLDIGANYGQYASGLRKMGYAGRILSFEPVKSSYERLQKNCENDHEWHAYNLALGSLDCTKPINVTRDSSMASFFIPNDYSKQCYNNKVSVDHAEYVDTRRLDSLFPDIVRGVTEPRIFMKMDTQGYDLDVVNGADVSMSSVIALQSELSMVPIYDDMPAYIEVLTQYRKAGFEITGLYPISRDRNDMRVIEFDCVMVRA